MRVIILIKAKTKEKKGGTIYLFEREETRQGP